MKARYAIHNKTTNVRCEAEKTERGLEALRTLRKLDPRFKRRVITDVIQMIPEAVPLNEEGRSEIIDCTQQLAS